MFTEEERMLSEFNPTNELMFIRKMMQDSQRIVVDNGMHYMFWGVWTACGAVISYLSMQQRWGLGVFIWAVAIPIGWIISGIMIRRNIRTLGVQTLASRLLTAVWIGCAVAMSLIGFVGGLTVLGNGITGVMSIIMGSGFYISGALYNSSWLRYYAALGWWLGGVAMFLFPGAHVLLMLAAEMMLFYFIPGVVLYKQSSRNHEAQSQANI